MTTRPKSLAIALFCALPLLAPPLLHASTAATPSQQQVLDRFIANSNHAPQFEGLSQMVKELLEREFSSEIPAAERGKLATRILDAFAAREAREAMAQQLTLSYDSGRYRALIQRLEGGVVRKLRDMERAIHEPVARHELENFISRLPANPVDPKREKLIKELLEAGGFIDSAVKTRVTLQQVVRELAAANGGSGRISTSGTQEQRDALARSLRQEVESRTLAAALFTYRAASEDDIRQYIDFYNSPAGEWFKVTQQNGWLGALRNIGRNVAWQMQHPDLAGAESEFDPELGF